MTTMPEMPDDRRAREILAEIANHRNDAFCNDTTCNYLMAAVEEMVKARPERPAEDADPEVRAEYYGWFNCHAAFLKIFRTHLIGPE